MILILKKIHALVIPKENIDLDDFNSNASNDEIVGLMKGITAVSKKLGISSIDGKGYRALANISDYGGQEVPHLHFIYLVAKSWKNGLVITKIDRKYLEISSPEEINSSKPKANCKIEIKNLRFSNK